MNDRINFTINNEYVQFKDGDEIIYDSRWSLEELLNGGSLNMKTTKEQIITEIEECLTYNKIARQAEAYDLLKDATRKSNETLSKTRKYIKNTDEYKRGLNEAWELAKKIALPVIYGGYTPIELKEIYGNSAHNNILENLTAVEALAKAQAYEKKKEEEAAKPKLGDVVKVYYKYNGVIDRGVFLAGGELEFTYITLNGTVSTSTYRDDVELIKTGEHVDIQGMLDKLNE